MLKRLRSRLLSSKPDRIAKAFLRLGWIGFWTQIVLAALPIVVTIYLLFLSSSAETQRRGIGVIETLGLLGLLILFFTIFWFYRYTRMAKGMEEPQTRPPRDTVINTLWIGLVASCLGILFSMLLMMADVARLLYVFLRAPQGGVPVMKTDTYDPSQWVSAIDLVGLLADLSLLGAELLVLGFTLWLLFRMSHATEYE